MKNKKIKPFIVGGVYGLFFIIFLVAGIVAVNITGYYDAVIRDFLGVIGKTHVNEANDGIHISTSSISGDIRIQGNKYKNFTNEVKEAFKNER